MTAQQQLELRQQWEGRLRQAPSHLEIEYRSGGRSKVLVLRPDGALLVREYGGPVYHMGRCVTMKQPEVTAWRAQVDARFHALNLERLAQAGFPVVDEPAMLVPDEVPSSIGVREPGGPTTMMSAPHRLVAANPALAELVRAFEILCYEASSKPSSETVPNPELDLWR